MGDWHGAEPAAAARADGVGGSLDALSDRIVDVAAILSADLLTDAEVDELRNLVREGPNAGRYAFDRAQDQSMRGMYRQLSDLGFVDAGFSEAGYPVRLSLNYKSHWAIGRRDLRSAERAAEAARAEERLARDRRASRLNIVLGWALGLVTAAVTAALAGWG